MPKISIIVPVYNVAKYLVRCIDSILSQSFTDFELLLVNDGSSDDSGKICDNYAKKDSRIKVYHKENGGVSSARNLGLINACGDWIAFVDSDDYLLVDSLQMFINKIDKNIDLIICGYNICDEDSNLKFSTTIEHRNELIQKEDAIKIMFKNSYYNGYIYNKLFKRSIIEDNKILFNEKIYYNEDRLFCVEYLTSLNLKILYSSEPVYMYILHENSAMSLINKCFNNKMLSELDAYIIMYKILCNNKAKDSNINLAKEGMVAAYRRLNKLLFHFKVVNRQTIKRNMQKKIFKTISINDYIKVLIIFLFRSINRRLSNNLKLLSINYG